MSLLKCKKCGKGYKSERGLKSHQATHTGDEEFAFRCDVCELCFKSAAGLKNHYRCHIKLEKCDTPDGNTETNPAASPDLCDISDDEEYKCTPERQDGQGVSSYFFEDDDEVEEYLRNYQIAGTSQNDATEKNKKQALVTCRLCGNNFQTINNYLKHKATHVMTELYGYAPSEEMLLTKSFEIAHSVLDKIGNSKCSVGFGVTVRDTAKILSLASECEEWQETLKHVISSVCDFFKSCDKFLIPSDLRAEYLKSVALFSANKMERTELVNNLQSVVDISSDAANIFWGTFINKVANELLAFYINVIKNKGSHDTDVTPLSERFILNSQSSDTLDFKQVVHYIGGSNVKSLLRAAFKIKNVNNEWKKVLEIAKKHFLISDLAEASDNELMAWTLTQDRGGLIKINSELLNFFLELANTVKILEHCDGSLYIEEVMQKVLDNPKLVYTWDDILKGAVTPDQSSKLLYSLCSYFCNTWRHGIVTRRLDQMSEHNESSGVKHGMGGVAFRATLQ